MKLLEPIQKALAGVIEIKDANRPNPLFNNLSAVAEGIPALGWFTCVSLKKKQRYEVSLLLISEV
jgi:adenylyl cyclase-associated protein